MKTTELRIGNYVNLRYIRPDGTNEVWWAKQVDSIYPDTLTFLGQRVDFTEKFIKPIPLTEEWLLKFGFERKNKSFHKRDYQCEWQTVIERRKNFFAYKGTWMQHVHQLQNLYFALTNKELTTKE